MVFIKPGGAMLAFVVELVWLGVNVADPCTKTGPCSCKSDQGTIDLSAIASSGGSPAFQDQPDSQGKYKFSYNPCNPFTEGSCTDVAACQVENDGSVQYPTGSQDSADFQQDPTSGAPMIVYTSTDTSGTTRTTQVTLTCDGTGGPDTLSVLGETGEGTATYAMTLTSKHCCPSSGPGPGPGPDVTVSVEISVGTILCIVFIVVLVVYVGVGIAIQKGVRKAQGKEVIPNYNFWSSLPGLIKDGVLFTTRGCKGSATYDKV